MVITKSQNSNNNQTEQINIKENSDNESDISLPDSQPRNRDAETNCKTTLNYERDHEKILIEHFSIDMNHQIRELISIVRTLTERFPLVIEKRMTEMHNI